MMRYTVQLEPGVWIAPWDGDPGRTLLHVNAKRFRSRLSAMRALRIAKQHRPFAAARVESQR